jgi:hypothetical protein
VKSLTRELDQKEPLLTQKSFFKNLHPNGALGIEYWELSISHFPEQLRSRILNMLSIQNGD